MHITGVQKDIIRNNWWEGEPVVSLSCLHSNLTTQPCDVSWLPPNKEGKLGSFTSRGSTQRFGGIMSGSKGSMSGSRSSMQGFGGTVSGSRISISGSRGSMSGAPPSITPPNPDTDKPINDIVEQILSENSPAFNKLWIKDGEPLLQIDALKTLLMKAPHGMTRLLETNGSLPQYVAEIMPLIHQCSITLHPHHLNEAYESIQHVLSQKNDHAALSVNCHLFSETKGSYLTQLFQNLKDISRHIHLTLIYHPKNKGKAFDITKANIGALVELAGKKLEHVRVVG